jgi:hypothetical protein
MHLWRFVPPIRLYDSAVTFIYAATVSFNVLCDHSLMGLIIHAAFPFIPQIMQRINVRWLLYA